MAAMVRAVTEVGNSEVILMAGFRTSAIPWSRTSKLNDVLRIILETMYRAKGFKARHPVRARRARNNTCSAASASGRMRRKWRAASNFSLAFTPDIFHAVLSKASIS